MEYYSAIKKNENLSFITTWIDLECIMTSEIKERNAVYFHLYVVSKDAELTGTARGLPGRGWRVSEKGRCWSKGINFQL